MLLMQPFSHWWRRNRADICLLGIYFALVLIIAIPVLGQFGTHTITLPGDSSLWLWMGWWRRITLFNGLDPQFIPINVYPFGTDHAFRPYLGTVAGIAFWSAIVPPPAALNIMVLGAYFLSAAFTYFAAKQLGTGRAGAFAAGLVYGFSAYMIVHSRAHVDQSQQWVIPLFFLSIIVLYKKRTWAAALWMGAALGLSMHMHAYYGYFNAHIAVAFVLYEGVTRLRRQGWRSLTKIDYVPMYAAGALVAALIYLPEAIAIAGDLSGTSTPLRSGDVLGRPKSWFFDLSSRPWDFFLPYSEHPIFGPWADRAYETIENIKRSDFTPTWFGDSFPRLGSYWFWGRSDDPFSNDRYLGYATLALAGWLVWTWWRGRKTEPEINQAKATSRTYWIGLLLVLFVIGIWFAQPPYFPIGGFLGFIWEPLRNIALPTPSLFTMTFVSPLRVVARFVMLAHLSLAMLVAFGIQQIGTRTQRPWLAASIFAALFIFEHLYWPEPVDYATPEVYELVADLPDGTPIMTYPYNRWPETYYQVIHQQPIIDSSAGISSNLVQDNVHTITAWTISPGDPSTAGKLAARGVEYVVVRGYANVAPLGDGFELVAQPEDDSLYALTAEPARLVVLHTLTQGLWHSERDWGTDERTMTIYVWNSLNEAVTVDVSIETNTETATDLLATRTLTPHPRQVYYSGYLFDNDNIPPDYDEEPVTLNASGTSEMLFQPGETTLELQWASGDHPTIEDIRFACQASTCVP